MQRIRQALFVLALAVGAAWAASANDSIVQACKKKATTDYRLALRHCGLVERGLRPFKPDCRADARRRYDRALGACAPAVPRKAGEDPLPHIDVGDPPPKDPKPNPPPPPPPK